MASHESPPATAWIELARRKTARAASVNLPPFRTIVDLGDRFPGLIPIGNAFTRRVFDGPFYISRTASVMPATSLVFVQSKDGNTGAANPATLGGGAVDLHIVYEGLSRVAADGVMAGARTLSGSRMVLSVWHPELVALRAEFALARHPAQVAVTATGLDLDGEFFANVPELPVFIVTTSDGFGRMKAALGARPWVTPIVMNGGEGIADALKVLRIEYGMRRLSCIGGARTASSLLDADLVADLYLTTAAQPGGEPGTPLYRGVRAPQFDVVVRKEGTGPEAGVIFEHLRVSSRQS